MIWGYLHLGHLHMAMGQSQNPATLVQNPKNWHMDVHAPKEMIIIELLPLVTPPHFQRWWWQVDKRLIKGEHCTAAL